MLFRYLLTLSGGLLRVIAIAAACASLAHAADRPGLHDSLGELLVPVPANTNRTLAIVPATQGRRIALVIGNGDYQHAENLPRLANPANDAQDIAEALRGFGFDVIERRNQTLEGMADTIAEFGSRIGGSEAALFYFAGHGIQVNNQNYLMPVNARITSEASVPYQGINVNQILDEMDKAKSVANIVMLDACRNNPISGKFRSGKSRGLASPGSVPRGTVIVYATDPGNTAADGDGRNGLFTAGLLTAFKGNDLSLDDVLTVASAEVERISGQAQTPYVNGPQTLKKNFHFRVTVDPGRGEIEKTFWTSIERSSDAADFEAYIRKYPNGSYRALAENQIKRLKEVSKPTPAALIAAPSAPSAGDTASGSDGRTTPTSLLCRTTNIDSSGYFEIDFVPKERSISIKVVSKKSDAFYQAFVSYTGSGEFGGIIQSGKQLSLTTKPENVNPSYALAIFEPNYDGFARIPEGVTRVVTVSRIPNWVDFGKPLYGVIWGNRTFRCLN